MLLSSPSQPDLPCQENEVERLRLALESSGIGTWDFDLQNEKVYWDDRCRELYGVIHIVSPGYKEVLKLIHPDDRPSAGEALKRAVDPDVRASYDVRFRTMGAADQKTRWLQCKGRAYFTAEGIAYRFAGVVFDVSADVKAFEHIQAARQLSEKSIKSSGIGLFHFDLITGEGDYSPAFAAIFTGDPTRTDLRRKDFINRVHPDDEILRQSLIKVAIRTGEINYEPRIVWDDGSVHKVRVLGACLLDESGKPASFSGTVSDITEQHKQAAALQQAEDSFSIVVDHAPFAMLVLQGSEMIFETVNQPMLDLLGKTRHIIGKSLLLGFPEIEGQVMYDMLLEVYRSGEPFTGTDIPVTILRNEIPEDLFITFNYTPLKEDGVVKSVIQVAADVTRQVKVRHQLEESEARFRGIIEEAPVATCLFIGKDHRVEVANIKMLDFWGKGKEALHKPLREAVPELMGQEFFNILDNVYATGNTYSANGARADLIVDGILQTFYYDFTYKALRNANGKTYGILEMAVDVTEQLLARQKLEDSELFARSVFESSPVAKLVFVGPDMVIKSSNENMLSMLGRDRSVVGLPLIQAAPELVNTELPARYRRVIETGETYYQPEERFELLKFGEPYTGYYNYIYKALRNQSQEIYGVMVTATEVTDQVVARDKIGEAEESLRRAVELAELGTWNLDLNSGLMDYSLRLQKWFSFSEEEEITIAKAYGAIVQEYWPKIKDSMQKATDPAIRSLFDVEYSVIDKQTGIERILHAQGKASFDEKGVAYKVHGTAQDVTQQRQLQLALEQEVQERTTELKKLNEELLTANEDLFKANEQLLHSNEELAQYAYVASHDLQEPLRKIRLYSGLLEAVPALPEQGIEFINKIIQSSARMTMLIRDLLEFSQLIKADRLMRPVNLGEIAEAVKIDFELSITEKHAEIFIGPLPVVEAVNLQINQLFYNLLGNALKFTTPGKTPRISVTAIELSLQEIEQFISIPITFSKYFRITFTDNGIGFDVQYSEQIFEVFKRLHGREMYPGSGIGLALCRRIVTNHNGYLYAESQPGEGTSFHIILPDKQQNVQSDLPDNFIWSENTN
ncbi:MAG: PAS domain-containing protein [Chitinophagaceae bacterium]